MINLKKVQSLSVSMIVNLKRVEYHYGEVATEKLVEMISSQSDVDFGEIPLPIEIVKSLYVGQVIGKVTKDRVTLEDGSSLALVNDGTGPKWVVSVQGPVREPKVKKKVVTVQPSPEPEVETEHYDTSISLHSLSL